MAKFSSEKSCGKIAAQQEQVILLRQSVLKDCHPFYEQRRLDALRKKRYRSCLEVSFFLVLVEASTAEKVQSIATHTPTRRAGSPFPLLSHADITPCPVRPSLAAIKTSGKCPKKGRDNDLYKLPRLGQSERKTTPSSKGLFHFPHFQIFRSFFSCICLRHVFTAA